MRPAFTSLTLATLLACGLASAAGCNSARIGGSTPPDQVIADLRAENDALKREVEQLNVQIDARLAELEAVRRAQGTPAPTADAPRLHQVQLAGLSGAADSDDDGRDDTIRLYVVTRDQHGRILPVEGAAVVQAVRIEPERDADVVAQRAYDAAQFRGAYRSGLAGTHYTLELPLPDALDAAELTVKVTVTDAATGMALSAQKPVKLKLASPQ